MQMPGMRKEGAGGKAIGRDGIGSTYRANAADDHYSLQQHRVALKSQ